jgi:hypothetical protein
VKWQDGKSKKMEVKRDFSIITLAQGLVRKKGEERVLFIPWRGKVKALG